MSLLKPLGQGPGYLKAGFLGFAGTGKTTTGALLAVAIKRHMKHSGQIAFYDTEAGSDYVLPMIRELTGQEPLGVKTRDFNDLLSVGQECVTAGVSVLLVDSVTHIWRNLCDSYLAGVNKSRADLCAEKGWTFRPVTKLEFQDWGPVKAMWSKWTDFYLTAPLHVIICGRAGFEYEFQENERGKKELIKTGTKMKTESEFGFEPSLLVEMEVGQETTPDGEFQVRTAFIRKDRFNVMDGEIGRFPQERDNERALKAVSDFFSPHFARLVPENHTGTDTGTKPLDVDSGGKDDWNRERDRRVIICEEIQGLLVSHVPGMGAEDKKRKADLMHKHFGSRSWTAIESMQSEKLRAGMKSLKEELETPKELS